MTRNIVRTRLERAHDDRARNGRTERDGALAKEEGRDDQRREDIQCTGGETLPCADMTCPCRVVRKR